MVAVAAPPRPSSPLLPGAVVRPLLNRTNRHAVAFLAVHGAALALTGAWVWSTRRTALVIPAVVAYGVVLAHLFAVFHECSHGTAFRLRPANRALAWVTGLVVGLPPRYFRLEHTAHHRYTQIEGADPELIAVPSSIGRYVLFVAGVPYWWWAARTLVSHVGGRLLAFEAAFVPGPERRRVVHEARTFVAIYAAALAVSVATGSTALLWLWLLPRLVGEPAMRVARLAEHAGRPRTGDVIARTRSLRVPVPLRVLAWNMPYHAEHHSAPGVPFHALPRLHTALAPCLPTAGRGYIAAHAEIVGQIRRHDAGGDRSDPPGSVA